MVVSQLQQYTQHPTGLKYAALSTAIVTTFIIFSHPWRRAKLFKLLGNKFFFIGLMIIIGWSLFTLRLDNHTKEHIAIKSATKSAILSLLIALASELKLVIAPFWFAWIAAYYLHIG
tara:strand:- start:1256 stop:1606 length:351 start_codon:yes stop_codon:yes gene_type:complete